MDIQQALMTFITSLLAGGAVWVIARIAGDKQIRITFVVALAAAVTLANLINSYFQFSGWKHYAILGAVLLLCSLVEQRLFSPKRTGQ
ncbi:hypothetical protein [Solilutibacter silvestris]|uniref:hypothetical protein n=1 Tax=Solilutibacter silvestris TaxID=1645665 RepID=UPI00101AE52E|nr:hypothetical protein [Lysobacter silvestris]